MLLGGAGVVLTLVSLTRALIAAVRDGNENTKQMVQNSKGKQFSPFTEGLT